MAWDPVQCCGVDASLVSGNITYTLEVSVGHEWVPGGLHHFADGTDSGTFRTMGTGVGLTRLRVEDLKPAQWYHWRVRVNYMGSSVVSPARAVPSLKSVPETVVRPRVKLLKRKSVLDASKSSNRGVRLRIYWSAPYANGAPVERYQLQVKEELDLELVGPETFSHAPIAGAHSGEGDDDENHIGMIGLVPQQSNVTSLTKWATVFCKQYTECVIPAPQKGVSEWRFRVRAKNEAGWGPFSSHLVSETNPVLTLIPFLFPFDPR